MVDPLSKGCHFTLGQLKLITHGFERILQKQTKDVLQINKISNT